jgi:hypothetical protein
MDIPKLGFEIVKKTKILMSHLLKEYLVVRFVTVGHTKTTKKFGPTLH